MSRVDRPVPAWGFRHPLNFAALLRGRIAFFRHNDDGLVIAAQVCTRRPLPQKCSGTPERRTTSASDTLDRSTAREIIVRMARYSVMFFLYGVALAFSVRKRPVFQRNNTSY